MATITAQGLGTYTGRRWYYRFKILPAKVTGLTLESRSKTRLTYIWNATPGANAYLVKVINRTTGKGFDKAVSTTRVDLTDLTDTQLYEVQVAAYRGNTAYRGPYSKVNAKHALPGTVTGLKTQKTATGSITLEWNKKPGADAMWCTNILPPRSRQSAWPPPPPAALCSRAAAPSRAPNTIFMWRPTR